MFLEGFVWAMRGARDPPPVDNHPLAREDGGWYPGKRFDPTDIFTDPGNWIVWKQFLVFFFSMLCIPVLLFISIEYLCRKGFGMKSQRSQVVGVIFAMISIQALMIIYARLAAQENSADYIEEQKKLDAEKKKQEAQKEGKQVTDKEESKASPTEEAGKPDTESILRTGTTEGAAETQATTRR